MLFGGLAVAAVSGMAQPVGPCTAQQLCAFDDPEDLADVAGTSWLIVSEATGAGASGLSAFDTKTRKIVRYPAELLGPSCLRGARGGGIGIRRDGRAYRLARILHAPPTAAGKAGGDAVESYRITVAKGAPRLVRAGCALAPEGYFLNDVAPLPDGGFAATHMFDPAIPKAQREAAFLAGEPTGYVVRWSEGTGWRRVPGSDGTFPNGIDVSADGRWLAFAEIYGRAINRIRPDGSGRIRIPLPMQPDNVTALPDGRFAVAGGTGTPIVSTRRCPELRRPGCGFPATAAIVDFATKRITPIATSAGSSTPGFSVGLIKAGRLYLGTAFGDRITTLPVTSPPVALP